MLTYDSTQHNSRERIDMMRINQTIKSKLMNSTRSLHGYCGKCGADLKELKGQIYCPFCDI